MFWFHCECCGGCTEVTTGQANGEDEINCPTVTCSFQHRTGTLDHMFPVGVPEEQTPYTVTWSVDEG